MTMATAKKLINKAISQIGVKESPANSNNVKYNTAYYGREVKGSAYPWCCAFIWWLFQKCDASKLFCNGQKIALCQSVKNIMKSQIVKNPKPGDLVLFQFDSDASADHIGILEKVNSDGTYTTIEGNTAVGNDANGGCVMRRTRKKSQIMCFIRPDYDDAKEKKTEKTTSKKPTIKRGSKGADVETWQKFLKKEGYLKSKVDGDFGKDTEAGTKKFQKKKKLVVDGIVGAKTWKAAGF